VGEPISKGLDHAQDSGSISKGPGQSHDSDLRSRGPSRVPLSVDNDNKENNDGRCIVDDGDNLRPIIIDGSNVAMRFVPLFFA